MQICTWWLITGSPCLLLVVCYAVFALHLLAIFYARHWLHRRPSPSRSPDSSLPGVTILKPLCGEADAKLCENLLSFFQLDYPKFEILFCVASTSEEVCGTLYELVQRHPHVDATVLVGGGGVEVDNLRMVNLKVRNLHQGYLRAKYDLLLVSDSGIWVRPDTLTHLVLQMTPDTALIHQLPFVRPDVVPEEVCSIVQMLYFGCWHARMYLGAACLGISCTSGMSCLLRKPAIDTAGGFAAFGTYLAEDFFISQYLHGQKKQWRVQLAHEPVWQHVRVRQVADFQERITRWYKLRLWVSPITTLLEPFTEGLPMVLLITLVWNWILSTSLHVTLGVFLVHMIIWARLDWTLLHHVHPGPLSLTWTRFSCVWLYREWLSISLRFAALLWKPNQILWKGRVFRLTFGGTGEDITTRLIPGKEK